MDYAGIRNYFSLGFERENPPQSAAAAPAAALVTSHDAFSQDSGGGGVSLHAFDDLQGDAAAQAVEPPEEPPPSPPPAPGGHVLCLLLGAGFAALVWLVLHYVPPDRLPSLLLHTGSAAFAVWVAAFLPLILCGLRWALSWIRRWRSLYRRLPLEIFSWFMVATGIFVRQNIDLQGLSWSFDHFTIGAFFISCVIALAVFPWVMRLVTKFAPNPGLEVIAFPFFFGFVLDLARLAAYSWVPDIVAKA